MTTGIKRRSPELWWLLEGPSPAGNGQGRRHSPTWTRPEAAYSAPITAAAAEKRAPAGAVLGFAFGQLGHHASASFAT